MFQPCGHTPYFLQVKHSVPPTRTHMNLNEKEIKYSFVPLLTYLNFPSTNQFTLILCACMCVSWWLGSRRWDLCILCWGNGGENGRSRGNRWERLSRRHMEQIGLLHSYCGVSILHTHIHTHTRTHTSYHTPTYAWHLTGIKQVSKLYTKHTHTHFWLFVNVRRVCVCVCVYHVFNTLWYTFSWHITLWGLQRNVLSPQVSVPALLWASLAPTREIMFMG